MEELEQALKELEEKSLLFGGKKCLIDIFEYLATNKKETFPNACGTL